MEIFNVLFYQPLYNILIIFYDILGNNLGLAIIATAVLFRALIIPLTVRQIKMAESSREMNEKVKEVKQRYKKNKEKQQEEMVKIQQEYLPAQISGCLPLIFQFILFINLYNVINNLVREGVDGFRDIAYSFAPQFPEGYQINTDFLGILRLNESASGIAESAGIISLEIIPYVLLTVGVGLAQFGSMRILSAMRKKRATKAEEENQTKKKKKSKKKKKDNEPESFEEIMQRSTRQTMYILPVLITVLGFGFPSGLSLYWITQSGFVIIQQFVFDRFNLYASKTEETE